MLRPTNEERGPARLSARAWTLLAVIAALGALGFGGALGRWVAFALILAVAPTLLEPLARLPWVADNRERLARWLPLALLVALTVALLGELALGRPPASRDHAVHYFQTKVLVDELIPHGELIGFSERLNTGYPFGDSYPVLGYVLTGAANLVSFGLISLRTSYAWGLLAIWLLALWAVWWLAATIARELRGEAIESPPPANANTPAEAPPLASLLDPRWAGALAAIAWLIDPGSSREGGWNYLMFHGVWPQLLSSALWIASLPATWAALRRPSPRSLAFAGLLLGGSVLAHPFGMLTAVTSAVAWPIVLWATGALRLLPGGQIRWWLIIHVLAAIVCLGWVVTFLASAGSMSRSPVPWRPLGELAMDLLAGELFLDHRAWVGPLTVIGLFVAIRRGRTMAWLGVGLACAMLVLGSEASVTVVRLDLLTSSFKNLQFPRYAIALKPMLYAFAGIGGAVLLSSLRELPRRDHPASGPAPVRPAVARLLACICLAPLVAGIVDDRSRAFPRPVGGTEVLEGSPHAAVDEALLERLRTEAELLETEPEPRELTVAFLRGGMGGGTYPLFAITDAGGKLVMDGHIPAVNYKYQVRRRSPAALRLMGVTHVIYDHPLDRSNDDRQLDAALEVVDQFGVWTLARLGPGNPPDRFSSSGKIEAKDVRVTRTSRTEHRVELLAGGPGRVDLPIGPYRKWSATLDDGSTLPLASASLIRGIPGVRIPFDGPGVVTLEYTTPTRERVAMWVSLVGLLLLLASLISNRELQLAVRLQSERADRLSWALGILTLAVVVIGGYWREEKQLAATWKRVLTEHHLSDHRFRADLVDSGAFTVTRSTADGCDGTLGKDAMAGCTQADTRPRKSMVFRAPYLYRCLHVQVPANGTLDIELDLRETDDLIGFFVRDHQHFEGLSVQLPGQAPPIVPAHRQRRYPLLVPASTRAGSSTIHLRNEATRAQGMCFGLAAAEPP